MGLARARATGEAPSIANMQGQRMMADAAAQQRAQAGSARGAAGLALAQQGAAQNTAAAQGNIAGQTAEAAARERMAAEQAYAQQAGMMRGQDTQSAQYQAGLDLQSRSLNDQRAMFHDRQIADSNWQQTQANLQQQQNKVQSHMAADRANLAVNQANADNEKSWFDRAAGAVGGVIGGLGDFLSDSRAKELLTSDFVGKDPAEMGVGGLANMNEGSVWNPQGGTTQLKGGGMDVMGTIGKANEGVKQGFNPMGGNRPMTRILSDFVGKEAAPAYRFDPTHGWYKPEDPSTAALNQAIGSDVEAERDRAAADAHYEKMAAEELQRVRTQQGPVAPGAAPKGYGKRWTAESDEGESARWTRTPSGGWKYDRSVPVETTKDDNEGMAPGTADYRKAMGGSAKLEGKGDGNSEETGKKSALGSILGGLGKGLMVSDAKAKQDAYLEGKASVLKQIREYNDATPEKLKADSETEPAAALVRVAKRRAYTEGARSGGAMNFVSPETIKSVEKAAWEEGRDEAVEMQRQAEAENREAVAAKQAQRNQLARDLAVRAAVPGLTTLQGAGQMAGRALGALSDSRAKMTLSDFVSKGPAEGGESRDDYLDYIKRTSPKPMPKKPDAKAMMREADDKMAGMEASLRKGPSLKGATHDATPDWLHKYMQKVDREGDPMEHANRSMQGFPYVYKPGLTPDGQDTGEVNYGPMAQHLAADPVAKTAVKKDPKTGLLALDRDKVLKLNSSGIASLQRQIDDMKARMAASLKQPPAVHKSLKRSGG